MNEAERRKIEEEVIRIVSTSLQNNLNAAIPDECCRSSVLCFLTQPFAYPKLVIDTIKDIYDSDAVFVNFGTENYGVNALTANGNEERLTQMAADCERIVLLAPAASSLIRLSRGESVCLAEKLVLRSLLWEKDIHIWLDFKPKKMHKSQFFGDIAESLRLLIDMGVIISEELWKIHEYKKEQKPFDFIGEYEAVNFKQSTDIVCTQDVVITPLAKDIIRERNIRIVKAM